VNGRVPKTREAGKDAIRVCAVYTSARTGKEKGIAKETRINRVGDIDDIVERAYVRMRSAYGSAMNPCRCPKCGSPTFMSKNKNQVCADLCWKTEAELAQEARPRPSYAPSSYSRRWRRTA